MAFVGAGRLTDTPKRGEAVRGPLGRAGGPTLQELHHELFLGVYDHWVNGRSENMHVSSRFKQINAGSADPAIWKIKDSSSKSRAHQSVLSKSVHKVF